MSWFKVDDQFWGHPKQTALPAGPIALWVRAGSWSGSQLTNGFVPVHMVAMLGAKKRDAEMLAEAGLWDKVDGGYQFHDWAEFQPSREQVLKERAAAKERMRKAREAKRGSESVRANSDRTSPEVRLPRPDPSRPEPNEQSVRGGSHVSSDTPPPLYPDHCRRHANVAEPGNCGGCADARKAAQARPASLPDYRLRVVPELCGQCDDRWIDTGDGSYEHCPRCHPAEVRTA